MEEAKKERLVAVLEMTIKNKAEGRILQGDSTMKVVMLRVGIDSGCGGIQGPLFQDGTFEFIPIPKYGDNDQSIEKRTYGNTEGKSGRPLIEFFPKSRRSRMIDQPIHVDPEFKTYTYGDPTRLKSGLKHLERGDLLAFYCGLDEWDGSFKGQPALYLIGYFEILKAGMAAEFSPNEIGELFGNNAHVIRQDLFAKQKGHLVLVKGSNESRLLKKAVLISTIGKDKAGGAIKILSDDMRKKFGNSVGI